MGLILNIICLICFITTVYSQALSVNVIRVIDGDSIHVKGPNDQYIIIRLFGIDAPELGQHYGKAAKKKLKQLVDDQLVTAQLLETDIYGRTLALLYNRDGININLEMIKTGYAWVYRKYHTDPKWLQFENHAKENRLGLWKKRSPKPPWIFRRN